MKQASNIHWGGSAQKNIPRASAAAGMVDTQKKTRHLCKHKDIDDRNFVKYAFSGFDSTKDYDSFYKDELSYQPVMMLWTGGSL